MLYFSMINISTNKQLGIMLPNTNKALAEVLKTATPQQLQTLSEGKDIKSILHALLQERTQHSKSDAVLLDLLKNNPTLKSLGKVSDTIHDLLKTLKSDATPLPIEKVLKHFLIDIKHISEPVLKEKLENSGIFLESRLKNADNPKLTLKTALDSLLPLLEKSRIPAVKALAKELNALRLDPVISHASNKELLAATKQNTHALEGVLKRLEPLLASLQSHRNHTDPLYSKTFSSLLKQTTQLLNAFQMKQSSPAVLHETLNTLLPMLQNSNVPESKTLSSLLNNIIKTLDTIMAAPQPQHRLHERHLPQQIERFLEQVSSALQKSDAVYSKELGTVLQTLKHLNTPQKLDTHHQIKEIVAQDLKAVLLQASDDIAKSTHPNQSELLKQIDKLALQIDYYQLMSHLCNASSVYLPLSWEQLEEGNITLNHHDEETFYCDIDLKLKTYGELKLRLILYDNNQLNLHLFSESSDLKQLLKEHIPLLRSALIDADITPREIRIVEAARSTAATSYQTPSHLKMGFEVKV